MPNNAGQGRKVIVFPLVDNKPLHTQGLTRVEELDVAHIAKMGPMIEQMRIQFEGVDFSAEFEVSFFFKYSVTGHLWSSEKELLAAQTADGQTMSAWYTSDQHFGMNLKFFMRYGNTAGVADEDGRVTAYLEVVLKS
ncbi:MAG: hypothetical protein A3K19_17215 [Lentisphaerae bacterium RIFOXYB12_FULL_65_16]|nr:MAG: hypothetical protein A3K18_08215 [Lentisphaerae bacterium RIFOXYA12_64_32]OGV87390.1 MAG: hypothetical protein A3K19_17215 [Lentisphaerae bacterium RIFOXYB12_FULL_65_16]